MLGVLEKERAPLARQPPPTRQSSATRLPEGKQSGRWAPGVPETNPPPVGSAGGPARGRGVRVRSYDPSPQRALFVKAPLEQLV